jgi:hypothetical protein
MNSESFGRSDRYYAGPEGGSIARFIPPPSWAPLLDGSYERVKDAYRRWNTTVRDCIRKETALRLSTSEDRQDVPVLLDDGMPLELVNIFNDLIDPEIALNKGRIGEAFETLKWIRPRVPRGQADVSSVIKLLEEILGEIGRDRAIERIQKIDQDVLGAYFFRRPEIRLYWQAIGITARLLNTSVEDLAAVVLIHELAHAYSHLGRDIDGRLWPTSNFAAADLRIVEGLAQFITAQVADQLHQRAPGLRIAFGTLATVQSAPYRIHEQWRKLGFAGEIVRAALIDCRVAGITRYEDFEEQLRVLEGRWNGSTPSALSLTQQ